MEFKVKTSKSKSPIISWVISYLDLHADEKSQVFTLFQKTRRVKAGLISEDKIFQSKGKGRERPSSRSHQLKYLKETQSTLSLLDPVAQVDITGNINLNLE